MLEFIDGMKILGLIYLKADGIPGTGLTELVI